MSTSTGSFASGSDFQASTTLGNAVGNIHRRTGSLELSSSHFRVTASEGVHISASADITGSLTVSGSLTTINYISGALLTPTSSGTPSF